MNEIKRSLNPSGLVKLWHSFGPSAQAALALALPYTIVDAVHYYTAGAAMAFSLPVLIILYLLCGGLAARLAQRKGRQANTLPRIGLGAGIRLWLISTVINSLAAVIIGGASFGLTLALGVPYLLLCAPVFLVGGGLCGWSGAYLYRAVASRIDTAAM